MFLFLVQKGYDTGLKRVDNHFSSEHNKLVNYLCFLNHKNDAINT